MFIIGVLQGFSIQPQRLIVQCLFLNLLGLTQKVHWRWVNRMWCYWSTLSKKASRKLNDNDDEDGLPIWAVKGQRHSTLASANLTIHSPVKNRRRLAHEVVSPFTLSADFGTHGLGFFFWLENESFVWGECSHWTSFCLFLFVKFLQDVAKASFLEQFVRSRKAITGNHPILQLSTDNRVQEGSKPILQVMMITRAWTERPLTVQLQRGLPAIPFKQTFWRLSNDLRRNALDRKITFSSPDWKMHIIHQSKLERQSIENTRLNTNWFKRLLANIKVQHLPWRAET